MELTYCSMPLSPESKYSFSEAKSLLPMLLKVFVTIFDSWTGLSESELLEESPDDWSVELDPMVMRLVMSKPWSSICRGYSERVFSSTFAMYSFTPLASDRIEAMPIMPMLPAKAVISVRPFFVSRFLNESESAVRNDMLVRREALAVRIVAPSAMGSKKSLSSLICPSAKVTMRVA